MLFAITVDGEPEEVAAQVGYYLVGLARANRLIMRRERIPPIYKSGVRYSVEPWAASMQSLFNCREALANGYLECKAAAAWLLAEHQERQPSEFIARQYDIDVTWKDWADDPLSRGLVPRNGVVRVFHARVLHPDGRIEDPTRRLQRR